MIQNLHKFDVFQLWLKQNSTDCYLLIKNAFRTYQFEAGAPSRNGRISMALDLDATTDTPGLVLTVAARGSRPDIFENNHKIACENLS